MFFLCLGYNVFVYRVNTFFPIWSSIQSTPSPLSIIDDEDVQTVLAGANGRGGARTQNYLKDLDTPIDEISNPPSYSD
jgi:hypothetical protein